MFGRVSTQEWSAGASPVRSAEGIPSRLSVVDRLSRLRVAWVGLGIAAFFSLAAIVPVASGPLAASASASAKDFPKSCGREGQKPCPLFGPNRHVPSCMPGLVERPFGKRCSRRLPPPPVFEGIKETLANSKLNPNNNPNCGGAGQKPCLLPIAPSCDKGLVEHFIKGRCIRNEDDIIFMARNTIREVGPVLKTIAFGVVDCGIESLVAKSNRGDRATIARQIQEQPCFDALLDQASQNGYRTLTLGASGGGALGVGVEGENGFAFDTAQRLPVATYHTVGITFGSLGVGNAVTVGLSKGPNNQMTGIAHGASVGFAAVGGGGAAVSFEYGSAEVASVSAVITAGAKFNLAYFRNKTEALSTYPVVASGSQVGGSGPAPYQPSRPRRPVGSPGTSGPATSARQSQVLDVADNVGYALGFALGRKIAADREAARPRTSFDICNDTQHKKIWVSWIYQIPNGDRIAERWRARGNFEIKQGRCFSAAARNWAPSQGYEGPVYFYASTPYKTRKKGEFADWQGDGMEFCVAHKKKKFTHKLAASMDCKAKYGRMVRGYRMDVQPGEGRFTFRD